MAKVLFFHGLNTYGDDDVRFGHLHVGSMYGPTVEGLRARGLDAVAITGLGAGTPTELARRALPQVKAAIGSSTEPVVLLGHSIGGLVCRALAAHPEMKNLVRDVLTVGTPHHGAIPVEYALQSPLKRPRLTALFKVFGYDASMKRSYFEPYTRDSLRAFNASVAAGVPETSFVCEVPRALVAVPLQFLYRQMHPENEPSDGFISTASQRRGTCVEAFALDHFAEIGYFFSFRRRDRKAAAAEFNRLLDAITQRALG